MLKKSADGENVTRASSYAFFAHCKNRRVCALNSASKSRESTPEISRQIVSTRALQAPSIRQFLEFFPEKKGIYRVWLLDRVHRWITQYGCVCTA